MFWMVLLQTVLKLRGLPWTCTEMNVVNFFQGAPSHALTARMAYGRAAHLFFRLCFRNWLLCFTSEHGFEIGLDSVVLGVAVDGRMNGIAYVELPDAATADAAKEKLHRKYLGRRFVEVRLRNDARHSRHFVTDALHRTYVLNSWIIFWFPLLRFR